MIVRRFHLRRLEDETGISGTGLVTDGIEFADGSVIMKWNTETTSVGLYRSIEDVIIIHGHQGRTVVEYADEEFDVYPDFLISEPEVLHYLQF
jgi:hypothetical protein